jgi:hypothetical protein
MKKYILLLDGKKTGISYTWNQDLNKDQALKEITGRLNMFDLKGFSVKIEELKQIKEKIF